jgi:hypothetical protein
MKNEAKQKRMTIMTPDHNLKKFAVRLLELETEHDEKIDKLETSGIEADPLRVDLLEVALDMLGVPPDNTVEMHEAHGQECYDRPDCFCRDLFGRRWGQTEKTKKGIQCYVDWIVHELEFPARN